MDRLASGTCRVDCPACVVGRRRATVAVVLLGLASVLAAAASLLRFPTGRPVAVVALVLAALGWRFGLRSRMGVRDIVRMVVRWPTWVLPAVLVPVVVGLGALLLWTVAR